jgi:toxin ParE1/3/4
MNSFIVLYTTKALRDLKDIFNYIDQEFCARQVAINQIKRIQKEIALLDIMPNRYELIGWEPWASLGIRSFPVDNFIVYYLVDLKKKNVSILRVVYAGRDIRNII